MNLAYIFDNTRYLGQNLYHGTRLKVFAEAHQQINGDRYDLYTVGLDARHYVKIHRTLIWANRFAAGGSFGRSRLIYYLGSVDNWINFSSKVQLGLGSSRFGHCSYLFKIGISYQCITSADVEVDIW